MHIDEAVLAPLRLRYGEPIALEWEGEISEREHSLATYDPGRTHDVTLFIFNGDRLALIRKPQFEPGIWRPLGETGLEIELQRYLVAAEARFLYEPYEVPWRTHVFLATTEDRELAPRDSEEIQAARWGTLAELGGPLRERLLATGRAFWRYRVALHDAAAEALGAKIV